MAKNLLIVESPAKAKTIEKILGKDFQVKSCFGHIRDLQKADMGIDVEKNFEPSYIVPADKERVVAELKKLAKSSEEVWLATDEDREGEAISWHLCEVLGLDPKKTKRIVFHEITKPAIQAAVENPRRVDMNLVMAQQARRILDRIVGFELSPVLWRKISMRNNLSAGRVQSVAVRLIAEREREINAFNSVSTFKIEAQFTAKDVSNKNVTFSAEGKKQNSPEDAEAFLKFWYVNHFEFKGKSVSLPVYEPIPIEPKDLVYDPEALRWPNMTVDPKLILKLHSNPFLIDWDNQYQLKYNTMYGWQTMLKDIVEELVCFCQDPNET